MEGLWSSLAISAIVTIVVYGAFPFISARLRKKPITKKKWKRQVIISCVICMLIFSALGSVSGSGASNGLPALIWGTLFYNNGIKVLTQRGLLIDNDAATVSPSQASAVSEAESLLVEKESVLPPPSQQSEQVSHSQERSSAKDISTFPPTESISSNSPPPSENTKKQKAVSHQKEFAFFSPCHTLCTHSLFSRICRLFKLGNKAGYSRIRGTSLNKKQDYIPVQFTSMVSQIRHFQIRA